jgi:ParB family chromosome partitioning protein
MKHTVRQTTVPEIEVGNTVLLPPDVLMPMPNQPRKEFDPEVIRGIAESAISLRARGLGRLRTGFTDVLTVRLPSGALDKNNRLKDGVLLPIVSGETRWRAALWANERQPHSIPELPCAIENVNDEDALELAYFANAHRKDLSALDEAQFLLLWKNRQNLTLRQLANKTGKTLGYIQNRMDVIGASPDVLLIFDTRPKALSIVRRIETVKEPNARRELIKLAKKGATHEEINDRIRAMNMGISVEKYQAHQEVRGFEKQYEKEAGSAKRSTPPDDVENKTGQFDFGKALTELLFQSQAVLKSARQAKPQIVLSAKERSTLAARAAQIIGINEEIESLLHSQNKK